MKPVLLAVIVFLGTEVYAKGRASAAQHYFTDTVLTDQNGRDLRFYSDLIRGRTVVINTFFAKCQSICPPLNRRMAKIQEHLGERVGRDVVLISITVDPEADTPPRLKEYARRWGVKPGWHFLSGPKDRISFVLKKLGQFVDYPEAHTQVLLVGNDRTQLWKKVMGLANEQEVLAAVESVVNDR